jgi:hypothetical protein
MVQAMRHGRGVGRPDAASTTESPVPIVGMDCVYITKEGVRRRDEVTKELGGEGDEAITQAMVNVEFLKRLLVRFLQGKNVFAHVVLQKSDDEDHYFSKLAVADIEWLGHTKIIIKTDNERAIMALTRRAAKTHEGVEVDGQRTGGEPCGSHIPIQWRSRGKHRECTWIAPYTEALPGSAIRQVHSRQPCTHAMALASHLHTSER